MRIVFALLAFLSCGFIAGAGFLFLGQATGWLNVHSSTNAPMWWRLTYAGITVLGTIAIAVMSARAAWRSSRE